MLIFFMGMGEGGFGEPEVRLTETNGFAWELRQGDRRRRFAWEFKTGGTGGERGALRLGGIIGGGG